MKICGFFGKKFPRKTIHRLYPHSFPRPLSLLTKPHTTIWDHFIASNIHGHVAADGRKPSSAYVPNLKAFAPGEVRCRFAPLAPRKAEEIETKVRYAPHPQRLPSIFHPKFRGANLDPPDKVITLQRIPALIFQLEVSCIGWVGWLLGVGGWLMLQNCVGFYCQVCQLLLHV